MRTGSVFSSRFQFLFTKDIYKLNFLVESYLGAWLCFELLLFICLLRFCDAPSRFLPVRLYGTTKRLFIWFKTWKNSMNFIALEEIEPKLLRLAWLGYFYKEKYTETCLNACGTSMESGQYYLPSSFIMKVVVRDIIQARFLKQLKNTSSVINQPAREMISVIYLSSLCFFSMKFDMKNRSDSHLFMFGQKEPVLNYCAPFP